MQTLKSRQKRKAAHNSGLAKDGLTCFVETFVLKRTLVLRMNFSATNPATTPIRKPLCVTMNTKYLLVFLIIVTFGCQLTAERNSDNCYEVTYSNKNINTDIITLTLDNIVSFDTTANLLNIKLIKTANGTSIKGVKIFMIQNSDTIKGVSDGNGEFEVFRNDFYGEWDITITNPEFDCVLIKDFKIGGGKWITIGLKK